MDKLVKCDLQTIQGATPTAVILDIRSNDLCDKAADPDMVALQILALVELLLKDLQLRCFVLCQVLPRRNQTIFRMQRKGLAFKWLTEGSG